MERVADGARGVMAMNVFSTVAGRTLLGLLVVLGSTAAVRAEDAGVQAVWTPKKLQFTYMGFTARYSCDGLSDKLKRVLLDLGARGDLKVTPTGCSGGFGRPSRFPGISATVQVLQPVGDQSPAPDAQVIGTHWKNVVVAPKGDPLNAAGDCELTEQIKQRILPLFSTRNVDYSSTCIPNQLQVGGTRLSADVLIADPSPAPAPASTP
jgi:hypothetical protein